MQIDKKTIIDILKSEIPNILAIYIFGSYANGTANKKSDIDIATHIIKIKKLGLPNSSRELFDILQKYGYINENISNSMKGMVGFRNIAVDDYQNLNIDIVVAVVEKHLIDFEKYIEEIIDTYLIVCFNFFKLIFYIYKSISLRWLNIIIAYLRSFADNKEY